VSNILSAFIGKMNTVVLESKVLQSKTESFSLLTDSLPWFEAFCPKTDDDQYDLEGFSPFLEHFLEDAKEHWRSGSVTTLKSGAFVESLADDEYALEAKALTVDGKCLIVLQDLRDSFDEDQSLLQAARENLLTQEALEIEVSRRTAEIRDREQEIAGRLVYAAGYRDEETGAHIRRIGLYAAVMARSLGWNPLAVDDIQAAAPMHDIGKIGIPDSILKKPGHLTREEFKVMKGHAEIGSKILGGSDIPMIQMAAEIAGSHHEFFNGKGYPLGLAGDAIPESARIVAIVDVYDALVHKRVYKEAMSEDETIDLMEHLIGIQFDPRIFQVFLDNLPAMRTIRSEVLD